MAASFATNNAKEVTSETAIKLTQFVELVLTKVPLWIAAAIVILLSFVAAKIARKIVEGKLADSGINDDHQEIQILGGRMTYSAILTLGLTIGLKIAGIDLTTILAAVAFGIGFALKDLIMNFLAGVMILLGRHFSIGDFINIGGTIGKVVEIQSRVTVLQAIDGTKVIVPNSELFKKQVTSYTSNPFRRIEVKVSVDYRHKLENVLKLTQHVVSDTKGVMVSPKSAVLVDEFSERGVVIKIKAWVQSRGGWVKIKSTLQHNLKNAYDEHGIKITWPMRTIAYEKDSQLNEKEYVEETEPAAPQTPAAAPAPATAPIKSDENPDAPLKPIAETQI